MDHVAIALDRRGRVGLDDVGTEFGGLSHEADDLVCVAVDTVAAVGARIARGSTIRGIAYRSHAARNFMTLPMHWR